MSYYMKVLQNYNNFSGRARRSEYWYFFLINIIISFVLAFVGAFIGGAEWIANIYSLAVMIPGIAVSIRRMHDINKSGWYLLIPIYNFFLVCTEGTKGANRYGEDTK